MPDIQVCGVTDFAALGMQWRELEQRADLSFFQSWSWVGCLATERFTDPVLVQATENGRIVALALFNRVRRRFRPTTLYLGESGHPDLDCPYVEHNGILTEAGRSQELTTLCLRAVASSHDLVLSGVNEATLSAVRRSAGLTHVARAQDAPFAELTAGADYLAGRSANTRQQIRRSDRFYCQFGPIKIERADSVPDAHAIFRQMAILHQASWVTRGLPGSFAQPFFSRFHESLIAAALPREEIALLRISFGDNIVGILYNFIFRSRMFAYQSGFHYRPDDRQAKPGLTCHHGAIRFCLRNGIDIYDFLAGEDRYKRSLADQSDKQYWVQSGPRWSPRLLFRKAAARLR